jgi:hypothetical protein
VAGEMMLGHAFVRRWLHPSDALRYGVELALMVGIIAAGRKTEDGRRKTEDRRQ